MCVCVCLGSVVGIWVYFRWYREESGPMVYITWSKDEEMSVYDNCHSGDCHVMSCQRYAINLPSWRSKRKWVKVPLEIAVVIEHPPNEREKRKRRRRKK